MNRAASLRTRGNEIDGKDDSFVPLFSSSGQHEATLLVLYDPTIASGTHEPMISADGLAPCE